MYSIWDKTAKRPEYPALKGDLKTDVLIIGGGMAGLLCGYFLKKAGVDAVIAEADRICSGVTADTTAKITYQHGLIYSRLLNTVGTDAATLYLAAGREALRRYRTLCRDIDCDFETRDSYVFSRHSKAKLYRELEALQKLGESPELAQELTLPVSAVGAVKLKNQAQFHPLKFAFAIARELKIYEHTRVNEITKDGALTDSGRINAKKVIVATHFPFVNKHGAYFLKMFQHRSYVLAFKTSGEINGMYVDEAENGLSIRDLGGLVLLGGGGHRTGGSGGGWHELEYYMHKGFDDHTVISRYATQDCITLDGMPYIGRYSKNIDNMYVATGFNKWGMTGSMVSAAILCDMVCGRQNPYEKLFSPSRNIVHPQLLKNIAHSALGLLRPTVPRCTHMGCALRYNPQEHSWDCPCHGSRFEVDGKLIDNPAVNNLNFTE